MCLISFIPHNILILSRNAKVAMMKYPCCSFCVYIGNEEILKLNDFELYIYSFHL